MLLNLKRLRKFSASLAVKLRLSLRNKENLSENPPARELSNSTKKIYASHKEVQK